MSGGFGREEASDPSAQTPCTGAGRGQLPLGSPAGSSAPQAVLPSQTLALLVTKGTICSCPCPGHPVSTGWARADLTPGTPGLSPGNWHQKPPWHPARDTQRLPSLWHRLEAARPGCPCVPRPHGGSGTPFATETAAGSLEKSKGFLWWLPWHADTTSALWEGRELPQEQGLP